MIKQIFYCIKKDFLAFIMWKELITKYCKFNTSDEVNRASLCLKVYNKGSNRHISCTGAMRGGQPCGQPGYLTAGYPYSLDT